MSAVDPNDAWALTDVITRLRRTLRASIRSELPWESLPMAQVEILQRLVDEPGLGVTELADRQRLARNTVSNLVQQMVTGGLLIRQDHPRDRRAVILVPSPLGGQRLTEWLAANQRRVEQAFAGLDIDQRSTIRQALPALHALVQTLEQHEDRKAGPERSSPGSTHA